MSAPTPDDLVTLAKNLLAEGHTSRAEVVANAARRMYELEKALEPFVKSVPSDLHDNHYFSISVKVSDHKHAAEVLGRK